jgi:uncharacterized protein YjiS (DUF1127 family)
MSLSSRVPSIAALPPSGRSTGLPGPGPGAILLRMLLWPVRVLRARREFDRLAGLSDHELRDIGLTRQDLRNASALSLDQDPTRHLAAITTQRRRTPRPMRP